MNAPEAFWPCTVALAQASLTVTVCAHAAPQNSANAPIKILVFINFLFFK